MRGSAIADEDDRQRALEEHRQELAGRIPKGPYEFSADLTFNDVTVAEGDSKAAALFKRAVRRDARHGAASAVYLGLFGLSQGLRHIYDGGGQLQDGEEKEKSA